jgi:multidrug efflux pump subunit AcrA (membrane-fusion protein)
VVAPATPLPPPAQTIGTPVEVTIATGQSPDALLVPRQALQYIAGRTFVEVLEATPHGQRPRAVAVRVGTVDAHHAEILAGLAEGQRVVLRAP